MLNMISVTCERQLDFFFLGGGGGGFSKLALKKKKSLLPISFVIISLVTMTTVLSREMR